MNGNITISRVHDSDKYIEISITDEANRIEFVVTRLTLEAFAQCVTGLGHVECQIETRRLDLVGKRIEHKSEIIPVNGWGIKGDETAISVALAPYEVDGWIARRLDMNNSKNYFSTDGVRVTFFRHVDR